MRDRRDRRRDSGMTLAELLVAMTLLALLSLMMLGGLRFGSRSWERTQESSEALNGMVGVQSFLRARLSETARPETVSGAADRLSFVALWMTSLGGAGLYEFELSRGDDDALVLSWRPAPAGEDPSLRTEDPALSGERVVLEGVEKLEIAYFGQPRGYREPEWFDEWQADQGAPQLVRIGAELYDPRQHWPVLIVGLPGSG
jgi:general secretion pathway protein J